MTNVDRRAEGTVTRHDIYRNDLLFALMTEAEISGQKLANAINEAGGEIGLALRYDRRSVDHWRRGHRPRPPVPDLAAEALSRLLGRRVTVAETGLTGGDRSPGFTAVGNPAEELTCLHEAADRGNGSSPLPPVYEVAALAVPDWAATSGRAPPPAETTENRAEPRQVGRHEVELIAGLVIVFADAEATFGPGRIRPTVASVLATSVAPWLHTSVSGRMRRRLFMETARLAYLCGFMCYDDEMHGLAQRYYLTALRLWSEAADPAGYAIGLRAMSAQAHTLGHRQPARQLAEAAMAIRSPAITPATRASLSGQLAVTAAATNDRRTALASIAEAERSLERATEVPVLGGYHKAALDFQRGDMLDRLGDPERAMTALRAALRHCPAQENRSRAVTAARLIELQLRTGRLDEATATWQCFLDVYPRIDSGRARTAHAALRTRLKREKCDEGVLRHTGRDEGVLHRARTAVTAPSGPDSPRCSGRR